MQECDTIFNNAIITLAAVSTIFLVICLIMAKNTKKIINILSAFFFCFIPFILLTIKQDSKIINISYMINAVIFYLTICFFCIKAITSDYKFFGIVKFNKRYAYIILVAFFFNIILSYSQLMVQEILANFITMFLNYSFITALLFGVLSDIFKIKNIVFHKIISSIIALAIATTMFNTFVYIAGINHQFEHFYSPIHEKIFMKNGKNLNPNKQKSQLSLAFGMNAVILD